MRPAALTIALLGAVLWAASGSGASAATEPSSSIASLLEQAEPGATVTVPAGVYHEQLVITRPVVLIGEGWPVIDGGGKGDVIRVKAPGVTIQGFEIRNSSTDVSDEPAGVRVSANNSVIRQNRISEVMYGIELQDSGGHLVQDNDIASIARFGPERRGHGVYLWHTTDNTIEGNRITTAKDGFFVGFSSRNLIEHNTVTSSRYGIHYMYAEDNEFNANLFDGNIAGGVLMYSTKINFTGNEFTGSRSPASGYALLFKDVDDVMVEGNLMHHNRLGIGMEGAPASPGKYVTLTGNLIAFNQVGIELTTTTAATFTNNSFMGNMEQVVARGGNVPEHNTWSVDGRGNYWDTYDGYDAGNDGIGDIPFKYDGSFDALVQENQALKAYAYTPARTALDLAARWFPAFRPEPRLVDEHPLMSPPVTLPSHTGAETRLVAAGVALVLLIVPLFAMRRVSSRFGRWPAC